MLKTGYCKIEKENTGNSFLLKFERFNKLVSFSMEIKIISAAAFYNIMQALPEKLTVSCFFFCLKLGFYVPESCIIYCNNMENLSSNYQKL